MALNFPGPSVPQPEETEDTEAQKAVNALVYDLTSGLPESIEEMDDIERGRWLLAQLLNWHRRRRSPSGGVTSTLPTSSPTRSASRSRMRWPC